MNISLVKDEPEWKEAEDKEVLRVREMLEGFCLGDENAVNLCENFIYISHLWDDLQDKDKERTPREINVAFCKALGQIPMSPIYQANVAQMAPLTLIAANTWRIANRLESGNADDKIGSLILRNGLLHLIYFIIMCAGAAHNKPEWAIDIGEQFFRDMFKGYAKQYWDFLEELDEKERQQAPKPVVKKRQSRRKKD